MVTSKRLSTMTPIFNPDTTYLRGLLVNRAIYAIRRHVSRSARQVHVSFVVTIDKSSIYCLDSLIIAALPKYRIDLISRGIIFRTSPGGNCAKETIRQELSTLLSLDLRAFWL